MVRTKPLSRLPWPGMAIQLYVGLACLGFAVRTGQSAEANESVDFARDVLPILQSRCVECHGAAAREGGLRFLNRADLLNRNDSGIPAIVPGHAKESQLIQRVTAAEDRMPPEGPPLTASEIDLLKRWIDAGATWPDAVRPKHWSYVAPQRPTVPDIASHWGRTPIDAFVLQRLHEERLEPAPAADPAVLVRRVYLDLIGIPPSVETVDAFLTNPSSEHYARIVDDLLASPRYGEKWARGWLDLARYADSNGFQADQFRAIWAYRDWVIDAMNNDMPFDQFTIEQLAGDLLPDATTQQRVATGFHRCTTCNVEAGVDPEENRTNQVIDRVNTTGLVWLGTSLECAQCHNHKYDPFTQQDYYQLFAFFNNTPLEVELTSGVQFEVSGPKMELPLPEELAQRSDSLERRQAELSQAIDARRAALSSARNDWEHSVTAIVLEPSQWHPLELVEFTSSGGATPTVLEDGSILLGGPAPANDEYVVTYRTSQPRLTGFKLEALTHPSLPGRGPGRGDASRPNFVLYEFDVQATPAEGEPQWTSVPLANAQADFSQGNWHVSGLIDGDPKTGWAINPQFGKDHWASFDTIAPLTCEQGWLLKVRLPQQFGGARTLGRLRVLARTGDDPSGSITAELLAILQKPHSERTAAERKAVSEAQEHADPTLKSLQAELQAVSGELKKISAETTLVMVEMDQARVTSIFKRGNFLDPLAEVQPATPAELHPFVPADPQRPANRLDFARWLVSRENPLVARVVVNRWWAEFFGRGLVETLEDFGSQGEAPTHPELLDWLAVEFMDSGWSMKHMHRLIVLSDTYQQDSRVSPQRQARDPDNKLYARGPRLRLAAELIRDNALAACGLLTNKMGGPPVYPPQPSGIWKHVGRNSPVYETSINEDRFRRGIYVVWRRSAPYPSFVNFDAPDRGACVVNRSRTNTPLQALTLLNDPAYVEMGQALARRMAALDAADDRERIEFGFRCVLSRPPLSTETRVLLDLFESEQHRLEHSPRQAEQLVAPEFRIDGVPLPKLGALFLVANVLLNLDESITKN